VQPALDDGLGGGLRVVPIAGRDVRPADQQLARLARRAGRAISPDHPHIDVHQREADRARLAADVRARQPERVRPGFGQAIAGFEVHAFGPKPLEDGQRTGRAAADHQLEPAEIGLGPARVPLHDDEHGRHAEEQRHAAAVDQVEDLVGIEAAAQDVRPAAVNQRQGEDVQPARVEQRRVEDRHVVLIQPPAHHRVDAVPGHVAVREDRALGQAGRPAGIADHPRRVPFEIRARRDQLGGMRVALGKLPVGGRGLPVDGDDVLYTGDGRAQRVHHVDERVRVDQDARPGVADQPFDLRRGQPPVEVLQDRADLAARHPHVHVGHRVGRQHGHAVALGDVQAPQEVGGLVGLGVPGGVRDVPPGERVADGEPVRRELGAPLEKIGDETGFLLDHRSLKKDFSKKAWGARGAPATCYCSQFTTPARHRHSTRSR